MFAFILIYVVTLASSIINLVRNRFLISFVFISVATVFTLVLGLRAETVGIDTPAYYIIFNKINYSGLATSSFRWEIGFVWVNKLISLLGGSAKSAILFFSYLSIYPLLKAIHRDSPNFSLSILLYISLGFYFFAFNGVRQVIAMSIVLYSFYYLYNKQYRKWGVYSLIAFSFHYSAIIFLIYFLLLKIKSSKSLLLIWIASIPFIFSSELITRIINTLAPYFPSNYSYYAENLDVVNHVGIRDFASQLFFIGFYLCYRRIKPSIYKQILLISMFGVILSNVLTFSGYLNRLSMYFAIFQIIGLPIVFNYYFKRNNRYLFNIVAFILFSLFYFRSIFINSHGQFPYNSWFSLL